MEAPQVILHIGLPKTGTTSLQIDLFAAHPDWHYLGKPLLFHDPGMRRTIRPIVEQDSETFERHLESFEREWIRPLLHGSHERVLISEEEFSTGTARTRVDRRLIAQRLRRLFPAARVIVTIRNQLDLLPSIYAQLINLGILRNRPFRDWIDDELRAGSEESRLYLFDYAALVELYDGLFGAQNICVLLFEDFRADAESYLGELAGFIGIDPERAIATYHARHGRNRNPRVTTRHAAWRRFAQSLPWLPWEGILMRARVRPAFYRFLARGTPLDTEFRDEQEEKIAAYFESGNRQLNERLGVDLGALGYPV